MIGKCSKFHIDTFNTFLQNGLTLKFLHNDANNDLAIIMACPFLRNRQIKNQQF